jgi:hypothetical protein
MAARSIHLHAVLLATVASHAGSASGQVMNSVPAADDAAASEHVYVEARRGFQMAARVGLRFPAGKATNAPGDTLEHRYSYQLPLQLDVGYKLSPLVHLGGYLGFAYGAEGSAPSIDGYCEDDDSDLTNDVSCNVFDYRTGLQAQIHFLPSSKYNPWLGYGIGLEAASQTLHDKPRKFKENTLTVGATYAKLDGGMDFRGRDGFGFGFYSEAAIGRYFHSRTEINGYTRYAGPIDEQAWHVWLGGGVRAELFP